MVEISRYNINIENVMEDLYIGPQAQVLEDIDRFNHRYVRNEDLRLGITPKFRWKPGSYNKVKDILNTEWLRWNMRPSGMHSIFNRERGYMKERLKEDLLEIENTLTTLRAQGMEFLTDSDDINERFQFLKHKIEESHEKLTTIFPNSQLRINNTDECFSNHWVEFIIHLDDVNIDVTVGSSDDTREIGVIPFGKVSLRFKVNMAKWFNNSFNNLDEDKFLRYKPTKSAINQGNIKINGKIEPHVRGIEHPFISRQRWNVTEEDRIEGWIACCTGEMQKDIMTTLLKLDTNSFSYWVTSWMSSYKCGVTGPLNNISFASIGKHKIYNSKGEESTDDYYEVVGHNRPDACWDRQRANTDSPEMTVSQCDAVECMLRDSCTGYMNTIDYNNLQGLFHQWEEDHITYEVLLPNHQEDASQAESYRMWITETFFFTNDSNRDRFEIDHELLFCNKRLDLSIDSINWLLDNNIIRMFDDFDDDMVFLIEEVLSSGNEHEVLKEMINTMWPLVPPKNKTEDELQDEMITWAIAQQNRR
tara:strand:- start:2343 stop:3938 length:1596 start_codon:yes stop_codon:yes gene_type:complete